MEDKIMLVDDAVFMRTTIRKTLEKAGYNNILEAADGDEAVAIYRRENPDLVLLDITMPGKSGIEVLGEIIEYDPKAKVVMCSAIGQEMMIQKAIGCGALEFIVKPFKKEELQKVVAYILES